MLIKYSDTKHFDEKSKRKIEILNNFQYFFKFKIERETNFKSINGNIYRKRKHINSESMALSIFYIYLKSLTELSRELKDVSQEIEYARARTFKKYEINKYCILSKKLLQDTSSDICSIPNPASVSISMSDSDVTSLLYQVGPTIKISYRTNSLGDGTFLVTRRSKEKKYLRQKIMRT